MEPVSSEGLDVNKAANDGNKDDKNNQAPSAPTPKRAKLKQEGEADASKQDPEQLQDFDLGQYSGAMMRVGQLVSFWNNLDEEYGGGREEHLSDLKEIVTQGTCSYQNPFGADDREHFSDMFTELTKREQKKFLDLAKATLRPGSRIRVDDLASIFEPPDEVFHVDLALKKARYQDGNDRFPFTSVEKAQAAIMSKPTRDGCQVKIMRCSKDCTKIECAHPKCKKRVCTKHGYGLGIWNEEQDEVWFRFDECTQCKKVACDKHCSDQYEEHDRCFIGTPKTWFKKCNVCCNIEGGEAGLGMHNGSLETGSNFALCRQCGTTCRKTYTDEEGEEKECGFFCCPKCFGNHQCGDDPSEYI